MHWHLILEEFGPELIYVKGSTNIAADALSHLAINTKPPHTTTETISFMHLHETNASLFGMDKKSVLQVSDDTFPLTLSAIAKAQAHDKTLLKLVQIQSAYTSPLFMWAEYPKT